MISEYGKNNISIFSIMQDWYDSLHSHKIDIKFS